MSLVDEIGGLDPAVLAVLEAARAGDLDRLRGLLEADPGAANPRWAHGQQPTRPRMEVVPLSCVSLGVFEGTNRAGNEGLLAQALIEAGADIELDHGGPLKTAISYYAPDVARVLLDAGAAVDSPDGGGMPLAYALSFGFTDLAEMLAEAGAAVDMRFAAGLGQLDVVRSYVLPDGTLRPDAGRLADPYENRFRCERTRANILCQALCFACLHARRPTVEFLLALGADVNQEVPGLNQLGGTVLHALTAGVPYGQVGDRHRYDDLRLPIIELLLRHGADANLPDSRFHSTALGWARHHHAGRIHDLLAAHVAESSP
ncbi:MAG TPA: hypothetical protein VF937_17865 [Chloroflexota bacterium]